MVVQLCPLMLMGRWRLSVSYCFVSPLPSVLTLLLLQLQLLQRGR